MAEKHTVSYRETLIIQGFLRYLQQNYSRKVKVNDSYLIAAIYAVVRVESGGFKGIRYNNPFNIRADRKVVIVGGRRRLGPPGKLLRFSSLAAGFRAFAKLLMQRSKSSTEYKLALNALKRGGNEAAVDFLAALSQTSFDSNHYGAHDWLQAYDQNENYLLKAYLGVAGVQLQNPRVRQEPPPPPPPMLPRDFNYKVVVRNYLDPWHRGRLYDGRHRRQTVDGTPRQR